MGENVDSFINLEFNFSDAKPEAATEVHALLAERATVNDAREPFLFLMDAEEAPVQGARLT
ncbi:hypothetical protein ACX5K5_07430 [Glutamicibacter bergerei]|nr:hypothetical protein [Micrococcaceae bacterium]